MSQKFITIEEALKNGNSIVNQQIKGDFVGKHVYANVNSMVEYILNKSMEDSNAPFSYDTDVENLYNSYNVQYSLNNSIQIFEGTESKKDALISELKDKLENMEDGDINLGELQEAIETLENAEGEAQEVYEWWIVSDFLCRKLSELGHPVISSENIWGRCTSGQAILLDYSITQICAEMGILEGQETSWAKS